MDHSIFNDGVLVDQVALRRVGASAALEILHNRTDFTSRGILNGGEITINAVDPLRIDVAQLEGYTPSGERILTDSDYYSIVLADYTLGTVNFVTAIYCEDNQFYQPTESSGITLPTYAKMSWRIRIYTAAQLAALPASDANLGNDALDRALLLGYITGNGAMVPLTASNIFSPTVFNNILYATPYQPTTIPGVSIIGVSTDTAVGVGVLDYEYAAGPTYTLRWNPPGAAWGVGFGWETFTIDEIRDLPGPSGTSIRVQVLVSMLSTVVAVVNENITITNLYYQALPRASAEDWLHRNMIGTGVVSTKNAHALSINDISDTGIALLDDHQDKMHHSGIWNSSSASFMQCTVSFPLTADMISIVPSAGDIYYINGKKLVDFAPTSFMFDIATIPTSGSGCHGYEVLVSDESVAFVNHKCMFDESGGPRTVTGTWIVGWSENYPAGAYNLSLTVGANWVLSWDSGESVTVPNPSVSQVVRLFAADSEKWVDVYVNTDTALISPDGNLPAPGVHVDSVIMYATPDLTQNLLLSTLCGWWDVGHAPPRFSIGFPPYGISREVVDTRPYGTLAVENISDSALQEFRAPEDELHESGVLYKRNTTYYDFATYAPAGLSISIRGGGLYCRGKRIDFAGATQVLYDNKTNLLYVDANGVLRVIDVTTTFAGSIPDAVAYVIGGTKLVPWASDVYHGDTSDPERGVVLYSIVTAGGAISSYTNLMHNVNGPVVPFSVSSFSLTSYLGFALNNLSAFDSLYSAFLYANLRSSRDYQIDVILNGISYVDTTIVQPTNVNVYGKLSSLPNVLINTVDAAGAWQLSSGCKVVEAKIQPLLAGAVSIKLNNNVTVEKCVYACSAGVSDIFLSAGATTYYNVHIKENKVSTQSSLVTATSTSNYDWWIENNTVSQFANGIASSLIDVSGKNIFIRNNKLSTHNSVTSTPAISGTLAGDYIIDGNVIELGTSADAAFDYGINLDANTSYVPQIINNTIKRAAGSASHVGIGIYVVDGGATIRGNSLTGMGGGIWVISNSLPYTQIEGNAVGAGYHFGIQVSTNAGSWTVADDITIRGNTVTGFLKNVGGVAVFGNDLYGIWLRGGIVSGISSGNMIISDNTVNTFATTVNDVYGITADYSFVLGGTSSYDGISINGNNVKSIAASAGAGTAYGVRMSFYAAGGAASVLDCRGLSVSSNNVRGILSTDEDSYGIYCRLNLDSGHTTGLGGLAVNGNNVVGFWGDLTDTTSVSAGITLDGVASFDDVFAVTCNNNNVASTSLMVAGAVHNDDTFVYGIYNNLTNSVISNNNISFTGVATTVRGDGIRCFPKGTALPTLRSVISGNSIDVNWTGLHIMGDGVSCTFDVLGNRINTKSVGIYMDSNVVLSSISTNVVYSTPSNACNYPGCLLTGGGCIVGRTSWPLQTNINGNNLTLSGSVGPLSANVWLDVASGTTVDNNMTYRGGAIVNDVYHIYAHDCVGACSISGNTIDNSVAAGANGIVWDSSSATFTIAGIKDNKILAMNETGAAVNELKVVASGGDGQRVYVQGNNLHLINASGAGQFANYLLTTSHLIGGGNIVNTYRTIGAGAYIYANSTSNDLTSSPLDF